MLIAFFFGVLFFIYIFTSRSDEKISIIVKVTDPTAWNIQRKPSVEFAAAFLEGDVEKNEFGNVLSEIVGVNTYQLESDERVVYLELKVNANYSPLKEQHSMKGRAITFGQPFVFNFQNVKFEGLVVDYPTFKSAKTESTWFVNTQIRAENRYFSDTYGIPKYIANSIKVGDSVVDSRGTKIIEVKSIKIEPAKRTITDGGRSYTINDPELVDVYLDLEINGFEISGERYIYDYYPLKVGSGVPVSTTDYTILPTILSFEE